MKLLELPLFCIVLTLAGVQIGLWCQKKWKKPIFNPTAIGAILTGGVLLALKIPVKDYQASVAGLSWLMTPATVALAVPMYEHFQALKKNTPAIVVSVCAGALCSMAVIALAGPALGLGREMVVSLLPKGVTTAIAVPLSRDSGGLEGITAAAVILTGILANMTGPWICKLFGIRDKTAQGTAMGTAGHVIATSRACEMAPLTGAVSSLSLVVAGLLTALVFPLVLRLLP